jgi:hypothetical protein
MLKMASSFVLARHCRLTISAAFTNVTRFTQRVVNLRSSTYDAQYASPLRSLRPRWTTILNILLDSVSWFMTSGDPVLPAVTIVSHETGRAKDFRRSA